MKVFSIVVFLIICALHETKAQDINNRNNNYSAWITLIDEPYSVQGTLYALNDSSLLVSDYIIFSEYIIDDSPTIELEIINIELIETRKRNRVGKGVILGAASGFAVGGLIGLARGDDADYSAGHNAIRGGVSLAIPGALIGLLVGSAKVIIPIEGSLFNYNKQKKKLQKYSTK